MTQTGTTIIDTGAKFTLLTNVHFFQFQEPKIPNVSLRVNVNALLISRADKPKGPLDAGSTLRGFGTEASNDRLSIWLPDEAFPFELIQNRADDRFMMLSGKEGAEHLKPIFAGGLLNFKNGVSLFLQAEDNDKPIDVFTLAEDNICAVWSVLFEKVAQYWRAPYMPHAVYHPPTDQVMMDAFRRRQ